MEAVKEKTSGNAKKAKGQAKKRSAETTETQPGSRKKAMIHQLGLVDTPKAGSRQVICLPVNTAVPKILPSNFYDAYLSRYNDIYLAYYPEGGEVAEQVDSKELPNEAFCPMLNRKASLCTCMFFPPRHNESFSATMADYLNLFFNCKDNEARCQFFSRAFATPR